MRQNSPRYRYQHRELYNNRMKRSLWAILSMGIGLIFAYLTISEPTRGNFNPKKKKNNHNKFAELKMNKREAPQKVPVQKNIDKNESSIENFLLNKEDIAKKMIVSIKNSDLKEKEKTSLIKILEYSKFKPFSSKNYIADWYIKNKNILYCSRISNDSTRIMYEIKIDGNNLSKVIRKIIKKRK